MIDKVAATEAKMSDSILTPDFTDRSYWLTSAPAPRFASAALPAEADVLVVGAGLTGLAAGHDLARGGRSVVILDAGQPGEGASSRNAGMLGRNTKHSFLGLSRSIGQDKATRFFRDLDEVFRATLVRIKQEALDCDYQQNGRIVLAHTPAQFDGLRREYEARKQHLGDDISILDGNLGDEIGSRQFCGGVLVHDNGAVHAGRFTQAFLRRAIAAGGQVVSDCPVLSIQSRGKGHLVRTSQGEIRARDVVLCTNGYTAGLVPWVSRRLIQIESYLAATEPLPPDVIASIFPGNRTYIDTTRRPMSMRLSPDGRRVLFGSRTGEPRGQSIQETAALIHKDLTTVFPQLRGWKLSNVWGGRCGVTWDFFPHVGRHDGIHYALGYNFSGLAMAPWLGGILARQVQGAPVDTDFQRRVFPGVVWPARAFDAAATRRIIRFYGWRDHAAMRRTV